MQFCCLLCVESVCFEDQHFPVSPHYNPCALLHVVSKTAAWLLLLELLAWNLLRMKRGKKCGSIKYLGFQHDISLPPAFKHRTQSTVKLSTPAIGAWRNLGLGCPGNFDCFFVVLQSGWFSRVLFVSPAEILATSCSTTFPDGLQTLSLALPTSPSSLVLFTCGLLKVKWCLCLTTIVTASSILLLFSILLSTENIRSEYMNDLTDYKGNKCPY